MHAQTEHYTYIHGEKKMNLTAFVTKKTAFTYLIIFCILALLLPAAIRYASFGSIIPMEDESFYNLRLSENILEKNDNFVVPVTYIESNPYHILIYSIKFLGLNATTSSFLVGIILGMLSVILYYMIMGRFNLPLHHKFFSMLFLVLSPVFIYTFSVFNKYTFIIFLQLLGFFLLTKQKTRYLSLIPYFILPFFGIFHALISLAIVITYDTFMKKKYLLSGILFTVTLLITLFYSMPHYFKYGFDLTTPHLQNIFQLYVSDLGTMLGFGLFALVLFTFGVIATFKEKYSNKYLALYLLLISLLILSYFYHEYVIYLNLILMIFSGIGFLFLVKIKWEHKFIRNFAIFIILLGILFSGVSHINRLSFSYPHQDHLDAAEWIKANAPVDSVIFSHPSNGHFIQYAAERKVLLDSSLDRTDSLDKFLGITDDIIYSRSLKETKQHMIDNNIAYVFIDERMKKGLVWDRDEQGLLFILNNAPDFEKVFSNKEVEIWQLK